MVIKYFTTRKEQKWKRYLGGNVVFGVVTRRMENITGNQLYITGTSLPQT